MALKKKKLGLAPLPKAAPTLAEIRSQIKGERIVMKAASKKIAELTRLSLQLKKTKLKSKKRPYCRNAA